MFECEVCNNEVEELFECYNCEIKMCFDCVGVDDRCPDCGQKGKIFSIEGK